MIEDALADLKNSSIPLDLINVIDTLENSLVVGKTLSAMYEVVITNPPYMGSSRMNSSLSNFAKKQFPNSKSDLFAMFMEHFNGRIVKNGYNAMVTMQSWMFLSSFETMRTYLLEKYTISNLMHMENNVMGIAFGTAVTIVRNVNLPTFVGTYHQIKTADVSGKVPKNLPIYGNRYNRTNQANFSLIPGSPIAYWIPSAISALFSGATIENQYSAKEGVGTRNDAMFMRYIWEVSDKRIGVDKRWIQTDKAGGYRKWFMGPRMVMDWENDGYRIKNYRNEDGSLRSRPQNTQYLFQKGVTWGKVGSGATSFRYRPTVWGFNDAAPTLFEKNNEENYFEILAFLNSVVAKYFLTVQGGTINVTGGVIEKLPLPSLSEQTLQIVNDYSRGSVQLSKFEWDSYETSVDFKINPLLTHIDEHNRNWNGFSKQNHCNVPILSQIIFLEEYYG